MEEKKKDVKEIKKDVASKENNKKTENSSKNRKTEDIKSNKEESKTVNNIKTEEKKKSSNEKEMKPSRIDNKLKITLSILVIILVCAISFGGIFIQDKGRVNSIIPEYSLGMDLEGSRKLGVIVDDTVNEVIYDKDGKVVTEEGKDTTKKEEPVNPKEVLTKENFEKSKEYNKEDLNKKRDAFYRRFIESGVE